MPDFLQSTPADLKRAADLLQQGELVAIPTETVYGLAANAFDEHAVRTIFTVKGRPLIDPLILHLADVRQLEQIAATDNEHLATVANEFWPGPLTVILKKKNCVSDLVTAGRETVAVRVPDHPVAQAILKACNLPLAAPSANPFGYVSPTRPEHVADSFGAKVPYIVDGGPCENGIESTIIDLSADAPTLRRPGPISQQQLEARTGIAFSVVHAQQDVATSTGEMAPGSLYKHYSPKATLLLLGEPPTEIPAIPFDLNQVASAYVALTRTPRFPELAAKCQLFWLSETPNNLKVIGQNTFGILRQLDQMGFARIFFERPPAYEMGIAINDRLQRAAAQ